MRGHSEVRYFLRAGRPVINKLSGMSVGQVDGLNLLLPLRISLEGVPTRRQIGEQDRIRYDIQNRIPLAIFDLHVHAVFAVIG